MTQYHAAWAGIELTTLNAVYFYHNLVDKSENHTGKDQVFLDFGYNKFFFFFHIKGVLPLKCVLLYQSYVPRCEFGHWAILLASNGIY